MDNLQSLRDVLQEVIQPMCAELVQLRSEVADLRAVAAGNQAVIPKGKVPTKDAMELLGLSQWKLLNYIRIGVLPVDGAAVANLSSGDRPTYKFDVEVCSELIQQYEALSPVVREQMYG